MNHKHLPFGQSDTTDLTAPFATSLDNSPFADGAAVFQPPSPIFATGAAATAAAAGPLQALYLQEAGTTNVISVMDINQGAYGDCYLLSAIGEIAINDPDEIKNMIRSDGHGGELVNLFTGPKNQLVNLSTKSFTARTVDVTNSFSSSSVDSFTNSDVMKGVKEIWPQVLEKAYADLNGGYAAIGNGGYDMVAMETLTGHAASYTPIGTANLATLQNQKPGTIMEFDTPNSAKLGYNLVGDHAYMFDGFQTSKTGTMVKLLNPWGNHEPDLIPWSQISHQIAGITTGHIV